MGHGTFAAARYAWSLTDARGVKRTKDRKGTEEKGTGGETERELRTMIRARKDKHRDEHEGPKRGEPHEGSACGRT